MTNYSNTTMDPFVFGELESFIRTVPFGLCVVDLALRFRYVNEIAAAINKMPVEDYLGRTVQDVYPERAEEYEAACLRVIHSREPVRDHDLTEPVPDSSGMPSYWSRHYFPYCSSDGALSGVVIILRNITKRKQKGLEVEELLRFEVLLSELSSTFVNLPAHEIDLKICDGLKSIVEFLGFDRSAISEFTEDQTQLVRTHWYSIPGVRMMPYESMADRLPEWVKSVRRGISSFSNVNELPAKSWREKEMSESLGYKSVISIPLIVGKTVLGAVVFSSAHLERKWPEDLTRRLRLVGEIFAGALERKRAELKLEKAFREINKLKDQLEAENIYLRDEIQVLHRHEEILGQSDPIRKTLNQVEQVAHTDSTVLILGETGTGKELLARAIHDLSSRREKTMVKVNCAALPATLIESELFGRERGAYTGALNKQIGRFEAAHGSTIFLDEIGELPLELQAKLLRVFQEGQFERLGSNQTLTTDARVITATNRDLAQEVKAGKFRQDLYYRLNVFPISVPPLRERREDIPILTWAFVREFSALMGKPIESISKTSMDACVRYLWPGNVRELRNVVERAMIMHKGGSTLHLNPAGPVGSPMTQTTALEEVERQHILSVLESTGWRVRGKGGAAELLNLNPSTLDSKLMKLGLKRGRHNDRR